MSQDIRISAYLTDICAGLKEKADVSIKQKSQDDYDIGYAMAMYEVISLLYQQAEVFDIALSDLGLEGIDPERDYLCANPSNYSSTNQTSIHSAYPLWEAVDTMDNDRIPCLDTFKFDGSQFQITLQFGALKTLLRCEHVLCFRMIEEGCAFHTLATQKFDGKAWLLKTDQSQLLDQFNVESESIYVDLIKSYIVLTQDQIFEFITDTDIQIKWIHYILDDCLYAHPRYFSSPIQCQHFVHSIMNQYVAKGLT